MIPNFGHVVKDFQSPLAQEKRHYYEERAKERAQVVTQPHRTLPMVYPKPKTVHDYPIGCYLNYMKDPTWHQPPTRSVELILILIVYSLKINILFFIKQQALPQSDKLRQVKVSFLL